MATGDIREIDMTKATDANGKKIRLVGDDGKGYWMEFSDLAAVVGGLLDYASVKSKKSTVDEKFTITNRGVVIAILEHYEFNSRTSSFAIISKADEGYRIDSILKTNMGIGFTVSEDGSYINCSGYASNKEVILIDVKGSSTFL